MTSLTHKAQEVFASDRYATKSTGVEIDEVRENYTRCTLTLTPLHRNAMGAVMGGVLFTLADLAFAIVANSQCLADNQPLQWVSLSSNIQYLGQTQGSTLVAETYCVKQGGTTCVYTISIRDEHNKNVALVTTTGIHIN